MRMECIDKYIGVFTHCRPRSVTFAEISICRQHANKEERYKMKNTVFAIFDCFKSGAVAAPIDWVGDCKHRVWLHPAICQYAS